ncbi:hypothetical protein ACVWZ3_003380 [Bradyrhizobium sp. i1.3.6]
MSIRPRPSPLPWSAATPAWSFSARRRITSAAISTRRSASGSVPSMSAT